jgi:hypothetical protein
MVETLTTPVQIGPRVRVELERRVRELDDKARRSGDSEHSTASNQVERKGNTTFDMADNDLITRAEPRNQREEHT